MATSNYELPDSTLQLIASSDFAKAFKGFDQNVTPTQTLGALKPDILIKALRDATKAGPLNPGVNLLANRANGKDLKTKAYKDQIFHPQILRMGPYIKPDVILPGAEPQTPYYPPVVPPVLPIFDPVDEPLLDFVTDPEIDPVVDPVIDPVVDPVKVTPVIDPVIDPVKVLPVVDPVGTRLVDPIKVTPVIDTVVDPVKVLPVVDPLGTAVGVTGTGVPGTGIPGTGVPGTGVPGTGVTGTSTTSTTGSTTTGTDGTSLRDTIISAVNGPGGSIDNSLAGLSTGAPGSVGSSLTADQIAALTKVKVPNVTIQSSGPALDEDGSLVQRFDYPELLSGEELKAYEAWLQLQNGGTNGGAAGVGKPGFEETLGSLEF